MTSAKGLDWEVTDAGPIVDGAFGKTITSAKDARTYDELKRFANAILAAVDRAERTRGPMPQPMTDNNTDVFASMETVKDEKT